jgi:hypothetical protein
MLEWAIVQLVQSQGGEWKVFFASHTFRCDTLDEVVKLPAVKVVVDITTVAGATNRTVTREMLVNGRSERKFAFRTAKEIGVEGALPRTKDGLDLPIPKLGIGGVVAQVCKKTGVGDISRVAEVAFDLHLSHDPVHQKAAGDTCIFVAAGAFTTKDVAASAHPRLAHTVVRPEGSAAICAVQ